jgi:UDP:flavonoid glycosyltransferase YjiC (YdhE family)
MRILIPTIGSRGDVQPFIALAQGLTRAGHTVTLASHPGMRALVESHGVTFAPIGPDIDMGLETAAIRLRSRNAMANLARTMRYAFGVLERSHPDILALCREADLVVVPTAIATGKNEADHLNLPYLSVTLMPWAIRWDDPDRPPLKRMAYGLIDEVANMMTTRPLNHLRKRQGLPPVGREGFASTRLDLVPISPAVYPPNPLWKPYHRVVGYWFVQEPSDWEPPAGLVAFLEDDPPPLLVCLGAMSLGGDETAATAGLFVDAIQQAGERTIVQGWESALARLSLPPAVYPAGSLPHGWLMPRCAGVVHHGGFGTTSATFRAGLPHLVVPHIADQFYWGQQVRDLGAGPPPIPRNKLDAQTLAAALHELAHDRELRATASHLGEQIRAEDGIENAVRLIEETFGK